MNTDEIKRRCLDSYEEGGMSSVIDFCNFIEHNEYDYCSQCETVVPILKKEKECLVCGVKKGEKMKIKTVDVTAKEWFDKANGNSYFSARIVINYGMDNAYIIFLPFQYGYGDHYVDMVNRELIKQGYIAEHTGQLWNYCSDNNIILRTNKYDKCLKREVVSFGFEM